MGKGAEPGSGSRCRPHARPLGGQSMAGGSWRRHLCVPLHRVPMGRRRVPPVPRWRQLLRAACWRLLSLSGTALQGLRGLWRLLWVSTMGLSQGPSDTWPQTCRVGAASTLSLYWWH